MRILNRLGGIPLASAYTCIKAISKKKLAIIAQFRENFIQNSQDMGLEKKKAVELFEMIEKFAGYGFNKSHSTAYALIAYHTAYLKAHYPVEFMAALLTGDIPGRNFKTKDSLTEHMEDCRRMNIDVVPPDVNHSHCEFAVGSGENKTKIYFALSAIKGCGESAATAIAKTREAGGPYKSLFDFCERVDTQQVNRAAIETLIKAGAFDSMGAKRSQQTAIIERAIKGGASVQADRRSGQKGLFDDFSDEADANPVADLPNIPEWEERDALVKEKEVLGFYLTSHPLAEYADTLKTYCTHTATKLGALKHRSEVLVGGLLSALKFSNTKNPRPGSTYTRYVMFDLEDMDGIVRCILWPEDFAVHGEKVKPDAILAIRGTIDRRPGSEEVNLVVNELLELDELAERYTKGVMIRITEEQHAERGLVQLHELLKGFPGNCELQLVLCLADGSKVYMKSEEIRVGPNAEMRTRVDDILGPGNMRLISTPPKPTVAAAGGRRGRR